MLRATPACTFSTSQLPKMPRSCGVLYILYILTWKCASRRNGVHFFISHLASPAPAALASLIFDPPEPQIIGKTQCFGLSYLFAHLDLLSLRLSYLIFSFFSSLLFSDPYHLCFSSVHIVASLASKLRAAPKLGPSGAVLDPNKLAPIGHVGLKLGPKRSKLKPSDANGNTTQL